jgi:CheY-like chemotaxis protein
VAHWRRRYADFRSLIGIVHAATTPVPANLQPSVLVVDDRPESRFAIAATLDGLGAGVVEASSGEEALAHLSQRDFAVVLLDVNMPRLDGFETAARIRARPETHDLPIIFATAYADDMQVARGYSLGAIDYILLPVVPEVLRTKVGFFVDLYRKNVEISRQAALLGERAARQPLVARPRRVARGRCGDGRGARRQPLCGGPFDHRSARRGRAQRRGDRWSPSRGAPSADADRAVVGAAVGGANRARAQRVRAIA